MNMNKKILFLILLITIFLVPVSALPTVNIEIEPRFEINETISFNYKIASNIDEQIIYSASVSCPNEPKPSLELKSVRLMKNQPITEKYTYLKINENIEPQNCTASVSIIEPYQYTFSKNFSIVTSPSFSFSVFTCQDQSCTKKSKIFIQKEDIFLNYNSGVENPSVTATLIYPDKTTKQISLPTSIKADNIGTYNLEATASKEGYQTTEKTIQFGVIEKEAQIKTYEGVKPSQRDIEIIVILAIVTIIVVGFLYFGRKKSKN